MTTHTPRSKSERTRARILDCATKIFATNGFDGATFVDVAHCAGITSQAIYRYFPSKRELYFAAVARDIEAMQIEVSSRISEINLPHMTGAFWRVFSEVATKYSLSGAAFISRDPRVVEIRMNVPSSRRWLHDAIEEMTAAQSAGIVRSDINIETFVESVFQMTSSVMIPLVFEGKYASQDWVSLERILAAAILSPMPDFADPEIRAEFERKVAEVGAQLAPKLRHEND